MATPSSNNNQNPDAIRAQLEALQLRRMLREEQEREEAELRAAEQEERKQKVIRREVEEARKTIEEQKQKQRECPHCAKNVSFVRGQWLGSNKEKDGRLVRGFLAFCQICLAEFRNYEDIPLHLRSDAEYFGGPKSY